MKSGWMLDDGPLGILARVAQPSWGWKPASFHLAESVAMCTALDKSGRRQALLAARAGGQDVVVKHAVSAGSMADGTLWGHLRTSSALATRDLGEDESIALLVHDLQELVFVVLDRKAAMVALAELGPGRVASPFDYWDWLRSEGIVDASGFDLLCARVLAEDSGFPGRPVRFR